MSEEVKTKLSEETQVALRIKFLFLETLSEREMEVFRLMGSGMRTSEISDKLNRSLKTVESHISHIKEKTEHKFNTFVLRQLSTELNVYEKEFGITVTPVPKRLMFQYRTVEFSK